jgi:hypothetical protein
MVNNSGAESKGALRKEGRKEEGSTDVSMFMGIDGGTAGRSSEPVNPLNNQRQSGWKVVNTRLTCRPGFDLKY